MTEEEIASHLAAERTRLEQKAGLAESPVRHFHRPEERPFTADEREQVTILFGGFTQRHEKLIQAVFHGSGYRCENLPNPDLAAYRLGREFGNAAQCNPTYFTVGNLIGYLRGLEAGGLNKQEILDHYVFFTAGSCGPCRFGMYESEYRMALDNAGFTGFRVLLFSHDEGIHAESGEPGLKFTVDFGLGMLNALNLGDVTNEILHQLRPYEMVPGETDRAFAEIMDTLNTFLRERRRFEILRGVPIWLRDRLAKKKFKDKLNTLGKVRDHLYGRAYRDVLRQCCERLGKVEVDRLRVKPMVKITGEFWAQLTEGDGNFNMFDFLEDEGAHVLVESIGSWVLYLMHQAKANQINRKGLDAPYPSPAWWNIGKRLGNEWHFQLKWLLFTLGERIWKRQYARVVEGLGNIAHPQTPQEELAELAHPFYHSLARGGEGHLEVGKNVYYTVHHLCHMVLALKPFGCMPSSQSDGVQSTVISRFPEMIFLPIETAGEGEINAHSRVQMALGDAKAKAKTEFDRCLKSTGRQLEDIRDYVAEHAELRSPLYQVPSRPGVAGVAANFVVHVSDLMSRDAHRFFAKGRKRA